MDIFKKKKLADVKRDIYWLFWTIIKWIPVSFIYSCQILHYTAEFSKITLFFNFYFFSIGFDKQHELRVSKKWPFPTAIGAWLQKIPLGYAQCPIAPKWPYPVLHTRSATDIVYMEKNLYNIQNQKKLTLRLRGWQFNCLCFLCIYYFILHKKNNMLLYIILLFTY